MPQKKPPQKKSQQSRLDEMARANGFPNYAAMRAWNEKYRNKQTRTGPAPKKRNFLQSLADMSPFNAMARRVSSTLDEANRK